MTDFYRDTEEGREIVKFMEQVVETAPEARDRIERRQKLEERRKQTPDHPLDHFCNVFTLNSRGWTEPTFHSKIDTLEQATEYLYSGENLDGPIGNPDLPKGYYRWAFFFFGKPMTEWFTERKYETSIIKVNRVPPEMISRLYVEFITAENLPLNGRYCSGLVVSHVKDITVSFWLTSDEGFEDDAVQKYMDFIKKVCPMCKVI